MIPSIRGTPKEQDEESDQQSDRHDFLIALFLDLHNRGFVLGIGELLSGLQVADDWWDGHSWDELKDVLRLLWCHSLPEQDEFDDAWDNACVAAEYGESSFGKAKKVVLTHQPKPTVDHPHDPIEPIVPKEPVQATEEVSNTFEALPVRVPMLPMLMDETTEWHTAYPITHRSMIYAWRYLRRPVADGAWDVLDIETTVQQATRYGIFLNPVYRRRERNHAHLLLLIDQDGSMVPFHRFTRDVAETASDPTKSNMHNVEVYYFHNILTHAIYRDSHMTKPILLEDVLSTCTHETSVLIVSDAGAARGYRRVDRIRLTIDWIRRLQHHTPHIAWLNPMPEKRWGESSARIIANFIPMVQMDPTGFSQAIDLVR